MDINEVLEYFDGVKAAGKGWKALCPAHRDVNPSLSISQGSDGRTLLHCHAGCPTDSITAAVGLTMADLFPDGHNTRRDEIVATYDYHDADGKVIYQNVRMEGKRFRQRQPNGDGGWTWNMQGIDRVLYRLPELLAVSPGERMIFVVEGEKSCDRVCHEGPIATTSIAGTNSWQKGGERYTEPLRGHVVTVIPDHDEPGHEYARQVVNSLIGVAKEVRMVRLPDLADKGDISDWLDLGGTIEDLRELVKDAPLITEAIPEWQARSLDYIVLPKDVGLHPKLGEGAGQWLDTYSDYAMTRCPMTPRMFHESAGLWLVSVAIARRLKVLMPFASVYPNLFAAWIAPTTLYRKTTALNLARDVARRAFPHLLAAQDTTPEAFLSDLAGRQPVHFDELPERDQVDWREGRDFAGQRGWMLDEMSGLLAAAGRDYNAGLVEAIVRFYDCDPYYARHTKGQGRVIVRNSYLSLIGASTPAAMAGHLLSERLWAMGWWPRFAVLTPENERPPWKEPQETREPNVIEGQLRMLYRLLPESSWPDAPEALSVELGEGVYDSWTSYNRAMSYDFLTEDLDGRLYGTYGRLATVVLKVAIILAALDWREGQFVPRIEVAHLARAMAIAEEWRASAHRAVAIMTATAFDRLRVRILQQVSKTGVKGASVRDVYRGMRDKTPDEIKDALRQMDVAGEVERFTPKQEGRGRPTERYRILAE